MFCIARGVVDTSPGVVWIARGVVLSQRGVVDTGGVTVGCRDEAGGRATGCSRITASPHFGGVLRGVICTFGRDCGTVG